MIQKEPANKMASFWRCLLWIEIHPLSKICPIWKYSASCLIISHKEMNQAQTSTRSKDGSHSHFFFMHLWAISSELVSVRVASRLHHILKAEIPDQCVRIDIFTYCCSTDLILFWRQMWWRELWNHIAAPHSGDEFLCCLFLWVMNTFCQTWSFFNQLNWKK